MISHLNNKQSSTCCISVCSVTAALIEGTPLSSWSQEAEEEEEEELGGAKKHHLIN